MNKRNEQSKTNTASTPGLKVQSSIKAGFNPQPDPPGAKVNHNQTVARSLKVKTNVKAGLIIVVCRSDNHNQTLLREAKQQGLRVKTNLKAGLTVRKAGAKELE